MTMQNFSEGAVTISIASSFLSQFKNKTEITTKHQHNARFIKCFFIKVKKN
jgi:hypothetical protein